MDKERRALTAFQRTDDRRVEVNVAGPMALVLSKSFKIGERALDRVKKRQRWERAGKDTVDLLRLLRATETQSLVDRMRRILGDDLARSSAEQGVAYLQSQFGTQRAEGARLLMRQAPTRLEGEAWAESAVRLTRDLLQALGL